LKFSSYNRAAADARQIPSGLKSLRMTPLERGGFRIEPLSGLLGGCQRRL